MKLGEPDASGRRRPIPIAGSEFLMDVDAIVVMLGYHQTLLDSNELGKLGTN